MRSRRADRDAPQSKSARTARFGIATVLGFALVVGGAAQQAQAVTPPTVGLGTADSFEVLASSTVTNTGTSSINNGDVGLFPGSSVTGFPPAVITNGVIHDSDAQAEQAQSDLVTAYDDAAGRTPDESGIIDLAGRTLVPGIYSGDALALNGTVTLNGDASSVFIFQAASTLITGSASAVSFIGGANHCNVFWKVGSSATLGSGSTFAGTILALGSITANSTATVEGRLLARTGAVTLDSNVITRPADCAARSAIVASTPSSVTIAAQLAAARQAAAASAAAAAAAANRLAETGTVPTGGLLVGGIMLSVGLALFVGSRRRRA